MRILSLITLLFTAGTVLLHFFAILGGAKHDGILRKFYWLSVDTSGIDGAQNTSEWTTYGLCGRDSSGESTGCTKNKADYPFQPQTQIGDGVPQAFKDHHKEFYYESRFVFPMLLVALFFEVVVLFLSLGVLCSRLVGVLSSILTFVAWLFATGAAALVTVWTVKGRNAFNADGHPATLGKKLIGFVWACVFMLTVNTFLFCCAGPAKDKNAPAGSYKKEKYGNEGGVYKFGFGSKKTNEGPAAVETEEANDASSFVRVV